MFQNFRAMNLLAFLASVIGVDTRSQRERVGLGRGFRVKPGYAPMFKASNPEIEQAAEAKRLRKRRRDFDLAMRGHLQFVAGLNRADMVRP